MEYLDILDKIANLALPVIAVAISWGSLSQKIRNIEEKIHENRKDITVIKDNHLAHIQACFEKMRADMADVRKEIYGVKKDVGSLGKELTRLRDKIK